MRKTLQQKRSELRDLMFSAGASDEQIRAKRLEIRQMQDKFEELQLSDFLAIRSVLTAEQKQRLATLKPGVRKPGGSERAGESSASSDKEAAPPTGRDHFKREVPPEKAGGGKQENDWVKS